MGVARGWVYDGPVLQALMSGRFETTIRIEDVSDPVSAARSSRSSGTWPGACGRCLPGRPRPTWAPVTVRYDGPPLRIPGRLRSIFPEPLAPRAGTALREVTVRRSAPVVTSTGGTAPMAGAADRARAGPGFTVADLGVPGAARAAGPARRALRA